jgi:hypothetical protein
MTLDDFKQHAEIWGGDLARWPAALQPAARSLAETPEARAVLAEAAAFDALLCRAGCPIAERRADDACFRVLSRIAAMTEAARAPLADGLFRWLMPLGGMAVSAALGVAAAHMTAPATASHNGSVLVSQIVDSGSVAADLVVQ